MSTIADLIRQQSADERQQSIIRSFTETYADLIAFDPSAWRGKFRKMSETAFAFYRGSAALFYADVSRDQDPFLNEQTSRVWIQGDLHAENFGTYMNGEGVLVFDVNDFDEAYVAPFTWDLKRFIASLGLIGYQKALSDAEIRELMGHAARSYARQIARFKAGEDRNFALTLRNTDGPLRQILNKARQLTRVDLLNADTEIFEGDRRFNSNKYNARIDETMRAKIDAALSEYYQNIPSRKKRSRMEYIVKDVVRRRGAGIGSAGMQVFSVLLEGPTEALENDLIISMKIAQPSAAAPFIPDARIREYFKHDGHRTAVSQRALQAHADPFLGYASLDGQGMYVAEVSPYTNDMNWGDLNDLDDMMQVVESLGRCIAKIHCVSDEDSDHTLVPYSTEDAIYQVLDGREADFVQYMVDFGENYADVVRNDYRLFTDAFRNRLIGGV